MTLADEWRSKAEALLKSFAREISSRPSSYPQMLAAFDFLLGPSQEIVLVGSKEDAAVKEMIQAVYDQFLPHRVLALRPMQSSDMDEIFNLIPFMKTQKAVDNKPTFYICENHD